MTFSFLFLPGMRDIERAGSMERDSLRFALADFARQIRQGVGSAEHLEAEILVAVEAGLIDAQVGTALAREAEEIAGTLAAVQRRVGHATPNGEF